MAQIVEGGRDGAIIPQMIEDGNGTRKLRRAIANQGDNPDPLITKLEKMRNAVAAA
ncbi:MAG: hypothetical protein WB716_07445 [Candidatus Acidiferrales bacterium]